MNYQERIELFNQLQAEGAVISTVPEVPEETFDVMTPEGYIEQLNRLYNKGSVNKEYYLQQVELMKNTYPISYNRIKEKLLMN